jgi:ABC-type multidrug transport system fused ATPase/permease subunit
MSQLQALQRLFGYAGDGGRFVVAGCCMILVDALAQMLAPAVFGIVLDRVQANPRSFSRTAGNVPCLRRFSAHWCSSLVRTRRRRGPGGWRRRWANNLRRVLYEHVQRLSNDFPSFAGR